MPMYNIEHVCKLTSQQEEQLAEAITRIHSEMFTTPRLFVNVDIKNISRRNIFVAGSRRSYNRIIANVRHGPSRTQEKYHSVCAALQSEWNSIVGSKGDKELRVIGFLGGVVAGYEAGFPVPAVGEDEAWMKYNLVAFRNKAEEGDIEFQELIAELETRPVFRGVLDGTSAKGMN